MAAVTIHLNDVSCAALSDDGSVRTEPAFAYLSDSGMTLGTAARAESRRHPRSVKNRFLFDLNTAALTDQRFSHLSPADLAAALIEKVLAEARAQDVVFVVPGYFDKTALGVLLGIAAELQLTVVALVDAAVAASRRSFEHSELVNLEIGLHASVLTLIEQHDELSVARHVVLEDCGMEAFRQRWLETLAQQFVEQSRFDPLHSAAVEQVALDALDGWLATARGGKTATATLRYADVEHQAELDPVVLIESVSELYQRIADALRALASAGSATSVQLTQAADGLPGLSEYLRARAAAELFVIADDAALKGASARLTAAKRFGPRRLTRSLPPDQAAMVAATASTEIDAEAPTHVLMGAHAHPLNGEALVFGTGHNASGRHIALPDGLAGVSKTHCSVHRDAEGCVLSDHSRYGTYLNGNRINGSTLLRSGDIVRIGTPGIELTCIRVVSDGA